MTEQKVFPVKVNLPNLRNNHFDIEKSIRDELCHLIPDEVDLVDFENFSFVVFLDSVDDLYKEELQILSKQINSLINSPKYRFIVTVRSLENINLEKTSRNIRELYLENFNAKQIERFVLKYFEDLNRGQRLINVLKESNILEKLPTTPLTLTLISLLYEDTDYEIPATLTDIYDDFVSILLGKLEVRTKTQLIDLELKKRVFACIAYQMLERKEFEINKGEFYSRIQSYLSPKGITLAEEEDILRLIGKSGILYIDHNEMVGFKHLSFLEYFASFQIFYVNNNYEQLIKNFNDVNWQNAAIFYAGISKDMPWFIEKLINGIPNEGLRDWLLNVGGMGYLSQALYMTDVDDRIKLISKSLDNMVLAFRRLKDLSRELGPYYNMPLHIIGALLVFWFNMNFCSVTLAHCLERWYEDYLKSNANSLGAGNFEIGFKLFLIAPVPLQLKLE